VTWELLNRSLQQMHRTIGLLAIGIVGTNALIGCGGDDSSVEGGQPRASDLLIRERTASRSASRFPDEGFQTIVRLQGLGARADMTGGRAVLDQGQHGESNACGCLQGPT
jgi:hypothetical protein